jgi:hypothetical protein
MDDDGLLHRSHALPFFGGSGSLLADSLATRKRMASDNGRMPLASIVLAPLAALAAGALACGTTSPATTTPHATSPRAETDTSASLATQPQVHAVATPTPQPVLGGQLSSDGPWLVFLTDEGLWAVNFDGSGLTHLIDRTGAEFEHFITGSEAPSGGRMAVVEVEDIYQYSAPILKLLTLPDGRLTQLTQLVPEAFSVLDEQDPSHEVYDAVSQFNVLGWSPDGSKLALAGAMDGPSSDLYAYDITASRLQRLTSGSTQTLGISWSPDGEWIVHGGGTILPCCGSGPRTRMAELWAARVDGSEVRWLYDSSDSVEPSGEVIVGWLDDAEFIVYSQEGGTPWRLRTFDIATREVRMLWGGFFRTGAMASGVGKFLMSTTGGDTVLLYDPDIPPGLRLIDVTTGLDMVVVEDEASEVRWLSDLDLFLALTDFGVLAVSPTGDFIDLDVPKGAEGLPAVSQRGGLAWTGSGLWVGSVTGSLDRPPRQVFAEPVSLAMWGPEGEYLLFFSEGRLHVGRSPDFAPLLVAGGMNYPRAASWVWR